MEANSKFFKHLAVIVIGTVLLLSIPFIAMQFGDEVNWNIGDFIIAGVMLIGTGLAYELLTLKSQKIEYKIGVGILVVSVLFLIWSNLAVGIIGSEDNPANLMYGAILVIAFLGTIISRLQPKGMSITLFTMAAVQMLIPAIALFIWRPQMDTIESSFGVLGVFAINAFFAVLFTGSGLLFKNAAKDDK